MPVHQVLRPEVQFCFRYWLESPNADLYLWTVIRNLVSNRPIKSRTPVGLMAYSIGLVMWASYSSVNASFWAFREILADKMVLLASAYLPSLRRAFKTHSSKSTGANSKWLTKSDLFQAILVYWIKQC